MTPPPTAVVTPMRTDATGVTPKDTALRLPETANAASPIASRARTSLEMRSTPGW